MRENTHTHIQDISRRIANELGFRKGDVLKVLKKFTKEILIEVYEGKPVALAHFGTFTAHKSNARMINNLRTGEMVPVAAKTKIRFHPYGKWKDRTGYEKHKSELISNADASPVTQDSEDTGL